MKIHSQIRKTLTYKTLGFFSFHILPTIDISKDDVFKDTYFEVNFEWLWFAITVYFDKK